MYFRLLEVQHTGVINTGKPITSKAMKGLKRDHYSRPMVRQPAETVGNVELSNFSNLSIGKHLLTVML